MAVKLDEIRKAAQRVAGSLGLDVVDAEFTGTAKSRILCIYLEKNAQGRAAQAAIAGRGGRQSGSRGRCRSCGSGAVCQRRAESRSAFLADA